jgi:hypothetical protein
MCKKAREFLLTKIYTYKKLLLLLKCSLETFKSRPGKQTFHHFTNSSLLAFCIFRRKFTTLQPFFANLES